MTVPGMRDIKKSAIALTRYAEDSKFWDGDIHLSFKKVFDHEHHAVKELLHLIKKDADEKFGGIARIVLEYTGVDLVDIEVWLKDDLVSTFIGVSTSDLIDVLATEATVGKLHSEIKFVIDGLELAKIHTSCSKPINVGDVHGDYSRSKLIGDTQYCFRLRRGICEFCVPGGVRPSPDSPSYHGRSATLDLGLAPFRTPEI